MYRLGTETFDNRDDLARRVAGILALGRPGDVIRKRASRVIRDALNHVYPERWEAIEAAVIELAVGADKRGNRVCVARTPDGWHEFNLSTRSLRRVSRATPTRERTWNL